MSEPSQAAWEPVFTRKSKAVALTCSVVTLVAGGVSVFLAQNEAGSAALITAGLVMSVLAVFGDRIKAFEAGGVRLELERQAIRNLREAEAARAAGDLELAEQLDAQADRLLVAAGAVGSKYDQLRRTESPGWERTSRMESLMHEARGLDTRAISPTDVARIFSSGSDGDRIVALALIERDPRLATADVLVDGIVHSQSAFEQFHALTAADASIDQLSNEDRATVRKAIESVLAGRLGLKSSNRRTLARQLLDDLQ